jgi:hypothetical protein
MDRRRDLLTGTNVASERVSASYGSGQRCLSLSFWRLQKPGRRRSTGEPNGIAEREERPTKARPFAQYTRILHYERTGLQLGGMHGRAFIPLTGSGGSLLLHTGFVVGPWQGRIRSDDVTRPCNPWSRFGDSSPDPHPPPALAAPTVTTCFMPSRSNMMPELLPAFLFFLSP